MTHLLGTDSARLNLPGRFIPSLLYFRPCFLQQFSYRQINDFDLRTGIVTENTEGDIHLNLGNAENLITILLRSTLIWLIVGVGVGLTFLLIVRPETEMDLIMASLLMLPAALLSIPVIVSIILGFDISNIALTRTEAFVGGLLGGLGSIFFVLIMSLTIIISAAAISDGSDGTETEDNEESNTGLGWMVVAIPCSLTCAAVSTILQSKQVTTHYSDPNEESQVSLQIFNDVDELKKKIASVKILTDFIMEKVKRNEGKIDDVLNPQDEPDAIQADSPDEEMDLSSALDAFGDE